MTLSVDDRSLVNWQSYAQARAELGANFVRILGYFREDGAKSVAAIEAAMRARSATGLVVPAHTLKGESRQFGADPLADLAETIEVAARGCIERHDAPDLLVEPVVQLRPLFEATLTLLEREANPLVMRRPGGFGRRAVG
ncbi:Hpt domain-containing protein [Sphingomonas sp. Y38-1Y]|uniref:Hpt domain-containing protein n=1 Tax=Sphingomonas sp. Y38-1Y TaxID=3078265 RepID=UPI0028EA9056|nr:Hpt domain-containing protein [Sphingomonas sp. Y38-1Y]